MYTYKVCVICPTYNRRIFIPNLIYQFEYQDYPKDLLTLLIYDDSELSNQDIFDNLDDISRNRIIYIYNNIKKPIGYKRNFLNKLAIQNKADYIVCFDDDDYYPPNKISYSISQLIKHNYNIGGSSIMMIYYLHINKIYRVGPFINKINYGHATNGTLIYHKDYLKYNSYDDNSSFGEESKFLRNFKIPLLQLDHNNTIICIAHDKNTINKDILKNNNNAIELSTDISLLIKDNNILNFYKSLI